MKKLLLSTALAATAPFAFADSIGISTSVKSSGGTEIVADPTLSYSTDINGVGVTVSLQAGGTNNRFETLAGDGLSLQDLVGAGLGLGAPSQVERFHWAETDLRDGYAVIEDEYLVLAGSVEGPTIASSSGISAHWYSDATLTMRSSTGEASGSTNSGSFTPCFWDTTSSNLEVVGGFSANYSTAVGSFPVDFELKRPLVGFDIEQVSGSYDATGSGCTGTGSGSLEDEVSYDISLSSQGAGASMSVALTENVGVSAGLFGGAPTVELSFGSDDGLSFDIGIQRLSLSEDNEDYTASLAIKYSL